MDDLRDCDMVMKGGITSGVVYPTAVADLSERYRFRSVGGASAGAIAAAAAAAAEHGRGRGGFDELRRLPDDLAADLSALFQPADDLAPVFDLIRESLSGGRPSAWRVARLAAGGRLLWRLALLLAALAGAIALFWVGGWAGLFGLACCVLLGVGLAVLTARDVVRLATTTLERLDANNFGFCDGQTPTTGAPDDPPPLTEWLTKLFNRLAGLDRIAPLTFGDLWGDDAVTLYRDALAENRHLPPDRDVIRERRIDLRMMGTNVSMGRPYTLPFDVRTYLWCDECWSAYFNEDVRASMRAAETGGLADAAHRCDRHATQLWRVPAPPDLPVVVAVRISLSYPVLFSAVPLFTVDRSREASKQTATRCWFADGGISSNFPIHLFDAMWPTRPTFGISLGPKHPDYPGMVYRPQRPGDGIHLRISHITGLAGFMKGIMNTMQNWSDSLQQTQPGYRDRVVEIRTGDSEGGLNIEMTDEQIRRLADRGGEAATELLTFDFDVHQWTRYRSVMSELSNVFDGLNEAWDAPQASVRRLIEPDYQPGAYAPDSDAWRRADADATETLVRTIRHWRQLGSPARLQDPPRPSPEIRITPRA